MGGVSGACGRVGHMWRGKRGCGASACVVVWVGRVGWMGWIGQVGQVGHAAVWVVAGVGSFGCGAWGVGRGAWGVGQAHLAAAAPNGKPRHKTTRDRRGCSPLNRRKLHWSLPIERRAQGQGGDPVERRAGRGGLHRVAYSPLHRSRCCGCSTWANRERSRSARESRKNRFRNPGFVHETAETA